MTSNLFTYMYSCFVFCLQRCQLRTFASWIGSRQRSIWRQYQFLRHHWKHRKWIVWLWSRFRFRNLFRKYHRHPIRSPSAGGLGSGSQTPMHLAWSVWEISHVQTLPCGHVGCRSCRFCWWQCGMLDADSGKTGHTLSYKMDKKRGHTIWWYT